MKTLWPKRNKTREHLSKMLADSAKKQKELEALENELLCKPIPENPELDEKCLKPFADGSLPMASLEFDSTRLDFFRYIKNRNPKPSGF